MNFEPRLASTLASANIAVVAASSGVVPPPLSNTVTQARALDQTEIACKVPGLSVAVALDGKVFWSEGFGYADLENKTSTTPAHPFPNREYFQTVDAAGLALLVEQGKLDMRPFKNTLQIFRKREAPLPSVCLQDI